MYRFLATPRWIAVLLTFLLLAGVMVRLGFWQLDRLHQKKAANAAISSAMVAEPVAAATIIPPDPATAPPSAEEWSRVSVTGTYAPSETILIRQRSFDDGVGFEIVVPLHGDDGATYLVDRGFVLSDQAATDVPPLPEVPSGVVTVVGYTKSTYSSDESATKVVDVGGYRSVRALNMPVLSDDLGYPLAGGYIQAADESTADGSEIAAINRIPLPELDEGPHLSYAVQWWLFATLALYGYIYMARREAIDRLLAEEELDDEDDAAATDTDEYDTAEMPSGATEPTVSHGAS